MVRCFHTHLTFTRGQSSATEVIMVHCGVVVSPIHKLIQGPMANYYLSLLSSLPTTFSIKGTIKEQGCARLMSRESNLTRLRLK